MRGEFLIVVVAFAVTVLLACGDGRQGTVAPPDEQGQIDSSPTSLLPADSALAGCVRATLTAVGYPSDSAGIGSLKSLDAHSQGIASLDGIERLRSLCTLNLADNNITDLAPLASLASLENLDLSNNRVSDLTPITVLQQLEIALLAGNQIEDIAPLLDIPTLTEVDVSHNPLSQVARNTQVTALARRGVRVDWDPSSSGGSPAGLTLAYSDQTGVYLLEYPGGVPVPLVSAPGEFGTLSWAPDGQSLAVSAQLSGDSAKRIYLVNRNGTGLHALTRDSTAYQRAPAWSPAGNRIGFMESINRVASRLFLADPANDAAIEVPYGDASPEAWSPKGDILAYSATGGEVRLLELTSLSETVACGGFAQVLSPPSWSPDGTTLAFAALRPGALFEDIYRWTMGDTAAVVFASADSIAHSKPAWAPTGASIAYLADRWTKGKAWILARRELRVQSTDGVTVLAIDLEARLTDRPCWSPDGAAIAFGATRPGTTIRSLYAVDVQSGALVDLLPSTQAEWICVAWAPR